MGKRIDKLKEKNIASYKDIRNSLINTIFFNMSKLNEFEDNDSLSSIFDKLKKYNNENYSSFNNNQLEKLANLILFSYVVLANKNDVVNNADIIDDVGDLYVDDKLYEVAADKIHRVLGRYFSSLAFPYIVDDYKVIPDVYDYGVDKNIDSNIDIENVCIKVFKNNNQDDSSFIRYAQWMETVKNIPDKRNYIVVGMEEEIPSIIKDNYKVFSFEFIINTLFESFDNNTLPNVFETLDIFGSDKLFNVSEYSLFNIKFNPTLKTLKAQYNKCVNYLLYSNLGFDSLIDKLDNIDINEYNDIDKCRDMVNLAKFLCIIYGEKYKENLVAETKLFTDYSLDSVVNSFLLKYSEDKRLYVECIECIQKFESISDNVIALVDSCTNEVSTLYIPTYCRKSSYETDSYRKKCEKFIEQYPNAEINIVSFNKVNELADLNNVKEIT